MPIHLLMNASVKKLDWKAHILPGGYKRFSLFCALAILCLFSFTAVAAEPIVDAYRQELSFKELESLGPITVAGKEIPFRNEGSPAESLVEVSRRILAELSNCADPCKMSMGGKEYTLKIPPLGQGERGVVFRINGTGQVIKISKPEVKSLAILRAESTSQRQWAEQQTKNFQVTGHAATSPTGLFSLMGEVQGEPLTNALFRLGMLQMDPLSNEVFVTANLGHVAQENLDKIWAAYRDMQEVIVRNPSMRTSLSPNNIFATWSEDGKRIEKIHLIDFGVDGTGDPRYQAVTSLNEYLSLSAEKIKGYASRYHYLDGDLISLQESARAQYNLTPSYDIEQAKAQMAEFIERSQIPLGPGKKDLVELMHAPLPAALVPNIKMNNIAPKAPESVGELQQLAAFVHQSLDKKEGAVNAKIGAQDFKVMLPALGQGDRGIVYALGGTDEVIKFPKPNLASVFTLAEEAKGYKFWHDKSMEPASGFVVPERKSISPLGIFSVMERDHGEPLTKAMLRFGLLSFDPATNDASVHTDKIDLIGAENRRKLEDAVLSIKKIMKENPAYSLSISPNNLHVNYVDKAKTIISHVSLIDVGLSEKPSAKFDGIKSFSDYVEFSENRLEKYLRVGYADAEVMALNRHAAAPLAPLPKTCAGKFMLFPRNALVKTNNKQTFLID